VRKRSDTRFAGWEFLFLSDPGVARCALTPGYSLSRLRREAILNGLIEFLPFAGVFAHGIAQKNGAKAVLLTYEPISRVYGRNLITDIVPSKVDDDRLTISEASLSVYGAAL